MIVTRLSINCTYTCMYLCNCVSYSIENNEKMFPINCNSYIRKRNLSYYVNKQEKIYQIKFEIRRLKIDFFFQMENILKIFNLFSFFHRKG